MSSTISTATVFWNSSVWLVLGYGQKSKLVKTLTYSERFDLLSRMVILMYTVAAWLGDRGIGYMCVCGWVGVCDWPHMFNSNWTMCLILPVYWLKTDTFKGFIHATLREVNSISQTSWLAHSPPCPGWFLHVGCLRLPAFSFTETAVFPSALLLSLISLQHLQSGTLYVPRGPVKSVLFYSVWVLRAFNRVRNLCGWGFYLLDSDVWAHITGAALDVNSWKVGIDSSVGVCVRVCQWACSYLQLMLWIYSAPPKYATKSSHTHARTKTSTRSWARKVRSLSLWHFHLTRSPAARTFTSMFPVPHAEAQ